ncbi:EAL domain-containing protein [Aliidiomarina maris]|uniref:EAL domain-containing protein (Putative c-di-GMP-specific phosphodiesterase class I) n=1 Tax=Aliidiomarina maris TaxID=531312 RepID=A0A327WZZ9_9GAMM|nr:EAL domain-containing protein [Aliidiomarina maris]RAJ99225.1 EAL domain-containing protein (putative c-di-GMP-specific phosphodiesterase class I) [Aliidiomarina maris]RUO27630.1 hypothetical protein CWE07_03135 [Aliidiomarina maris]
MTPAAAKIVILDDKLENLLLLEAILEEEGYEQILCIQDPRKMLPALEVQPDALLLDMRMPHLSGLDVIEMVQQYYRERYADKASLHVPPIMVLTADNDEQIKLSALEMGAQDYLTKPFNQFEVVQRLTNLLKKRAESKQQLAINSELEATVESQTEALRVLSVTDPATGLGNRRYISQQLDAELAGDQDFSLLAVAVYGMDDISRVRGQQIADNLQLEIARSLTDLVTDKGGWLGHYDSNMYLICLTHNPQHVCQTVSLITAAIDAKILNLVHGRVHARVGVYHHRQELAASEQQDAEQLLRFAIQAVPRGGDNQVGEYSQALSEAEARQYRLKLDLAEVTFNTGLHLALQPKIDLAGQRVTGAEALLRWEHPELGAISPLEFIALAEETGDIRQIGDRIIVEAMRLRGDWAQQQLVDNDFELAVNVAAQQLVSGFADFFLRELKQRQLNANMLSLEVTESGLVSNQQVAYGELLTLRQHGVAIAIDDFGTGYSSLQYINTLPADWIKIDRSFIVDLLKGQRNQFLLASIIQMAKGLGYGVVAEGVEQAQEAQWLREHGCDLAQGYYFARPLTSEALLDFVQAPLADFDA